MTLYSSAVLTDGFGRIIFSFNTVRNVIEAGADGVVRLRRQIAVEAPVCGELRQTPSRDVVDGIHVPELLAVKLQLKTSVHHLYMTVGQLTH